MAPIIKSAEPVLVSLPNPDNASGNTAGQTIAFAKPKKAIISKTSGKLAPPKGTNDRDIIKLYTPELVVRDSAAPPIAL